VTNVFQCDMTAVLADRAARKAEFERRGLSLTLTAYFVAACVESLRAVPEANGRWSENAVLLNDRLDIGIATALGDRGLVVPVIRDAGALDLEGIAGALGALVDKARQDALTSADLKGGTFTISNHGVSGSLLATPIVINQPQSAILGVGKLEKRAVVVAEAGRDTLAIRPCCYVTLTIDHRVLDGFQANRFMDTFVRRLEGWR
jgi:2-oxoglutarate dehydrogenase E2 component (dihydrolipoamide succinyltransferase)